MEPMAFRCPLCTIEQPSRALLALHARVVHGMDAHSAMHRVAEMYG